MVWAVLAEAVAGIEEDALASAQVEPGPSCDAPSLHNRYAAMLCHRGGAETMGRYLAAAVLSSADAQASATLRLLSLIHI